MENKKITQQTEQKRDSKPAVIQTKSNEPKKDEFNHVPIPQQEQKPDLLMVNPNPPKADGQDGQGKKEEGKTPVSVRTYRGDLTGILKDKGSSMAGMVIAEEKKREKLFSKISKTAKKNVALSVISVIFIVSGVLSVILLNHFKPTPVIKISDVVLKTLIYTEYQRELFLERPNKLKLTKSIQSEIGNTNIPLGSLIHFYITRRSGRESQPAGKTLLSVHQLLELIDARVSETLLRFLEPNFMFGFHSSAGDRPFLILKTQSFDNSYPEMLEWEENMIEDLRAIFIEDNPVLSVDKLRSAQYQFKDVVARNKDTRAVLDSEGKILFIYAFADKNTIVITTNKTTLQEVFDRLTTKYRTR